MVKEKPLKIECYQDNPNILYVNGEKYVLDRTTHVKIDNIDHPNKMVFKKLNESEYEKDKQIIMGMLSKKTNLKEVIEEALKLIDAGTARKIAKRIKQKKPIKKQHGCLGFNKGEREIPHSLEVG